MTSPADRAAGLQVAVLGATGRMGAEIIRVLTEQPDTRLCGASAGDEHPRLGRPLVRNVKLAGCEDAVSDAHVAIDFSLPEGVTKHLEICCKKQVPYVCGVTGLADDDKKALEHASQSIPVLWAPNMSIGVTLCFTAAAGIAAGLDAGFDVAVLDIHHAGKRDTPSGTALEFGRIIEAAGAPRKITFDSIREGEYPGEHQIRFSQGEELIEIRHRAGSRREFAVGAVRAARWLRDQPAGLYNMRNLLGLASFA